MEGLERLQNNQVKKMGIGRLGLIFFYDRRNAFCCVKKWADNISGYTGSAAF